MTLQAPDATTLQVCEIYETIQGETTRAGLPCVIVRLALCDLKCSWCDTTHAFESGTTLSIEETLARALAFPHPLVLITGGEPLLQPATPALARRLLDAGRTVLVETNGVHDIATLDARAVVIMDIKCPSSGAAGRTHPSNLDHLRPTDEVKFVIATREDYAWAKREIERCDLARRAVILVSWAAPAVETPGEPIAMPELAESILRDHLPVRFIPQLHKVIWGADTQGR